MNGPPAPSKRRGLARLLIGGTLAMALAAAMAVILPGIAKAAVCSNQTGTTNGMYYQMYVSGGSACITVGSAGNSYSTTWSGIGDFVAGVGWNPGNTSTKTFSGSMSSSGGTALMSLYGWSTNPLVEYYVIEDDQGGSPALGTFMGTVSSDGGTYNIYEHQQVNQPSIQGTTTFEQYLAIRQGNTTSGTITFSNFVSAWASHGMNLGTMNYQILATESFGGGSGSSSATVSQGGGGGGGGNTVSVTNPGSQSGTVGTAASVQVHATDSGGAALTYSASGLPAGLSINSSSGLISGTPTAAGTSSVTVTAKDSTGATGSTTFTWTISSSGGGGGGGGSCHVTFTNQSQWAGGFVDQVVIGNTSSTATTSWSLGFTFPGDQKITSNFNGGFSQSGENATLTNASYNGAIAAGGSVTVGFQGTWTSSDAAPTSFTLNGATCT
jgi:endo-1,4-beta-xylanase